ncbi:response regulator [Denitromonas iodatirespirans]|uniref:Virulence sensor protein BvgS n=1 Tax=Denitromonas iodatirespirans TaxID=2795389 RepID=A0A944D4S9_DENI1|nr:response regulator [Denitromonas iodatirespirans]MBT0959840.1 response regulator [Denitromonas iodatirespirans]
MQLSITKRLYALVALSVCLFVGLAGYGFMLSVEREIEQAKGTYHTLAEVVASNLRDFARGAEVLLGALAQRPGVRALDPDACDPLTHEFLAVHHDYLDMATFDAKGRFVCSALLDAGDARPSLGDTEWFKSMAANPRPMFGKPYMGRVVRQLLVMAATPIRDESGAFIGALGLPVGLGHLQEVYARLDLPDDADIAIIDGSGGALVAGTRTAALLEPALIASLRQAPHGARLLVGPDGRERVVGWELVENLDWLVIATIPVEAVVAPLHARLARDGLLLLAVAALALAAAWALGRSIIRPVQGMTRALAAVGAGDVDARLDTAGPREIATLGRAFNTMVDARAEAERALAKSEALFRGLLESSADAVVICAADGQILIVNAECERLFGHSREALVGRPVEMLVAGDASLHLADRQRYMVSPGGRRAMGLGKEVRGLRRDGSTFPAEVRLSPLQTDQGLIVSAVVTDITERKLAERALRDSEAKHRLLLESLPQRVYYKNRDSVFVVVNQSYARQFGLQAADFPGRRDDEFIGAERAERVRRLDGELIDSGRAQEFDEEFVADGVLYTHHTIKAPVRDGEGRIIGLLGISWDISDRKRAEKALTEATRAAEAANRAKSDFIANMSHEIRTPMNAVIGLAHLLGQTALDGQQRDYLDKIHGSARSLMAILNDVLDLSKVEAGKLEIESRPFRLDQMLRDLATILSTNAQDKDIEVLFRIAPTVPAELIGDALRLQQVLINLGGNAVKFTDQGEVVVDVAPVKHADGRIVLRFAIRDTGIGITTEQRRRLFQAFSQADSSTSRRYGGTGLGLAISHHLVGLMHGEIGVTSEPGVGSQFFFTAEFGVPEQPVARAQPPAGVPRDMQVLIVDDNPTAREVLREIVAAFGWQAVLADSGKQALARVAEHGPFDLMLIDWRMPDMDGLEASHQIRQADRGAATVILLVTAYGRDLMQKKADTDELDGLLVKPVTASMVLDAVATAYGAEAPAPPPAAVERALDGVRLLLAEDNAINQQVAREMLSQAGASVCMTANGREAVDTFRRTPEAFDAVLMDIQMPLMDGYTATAALRALPGGAAVPIIAMTANAMAADRERCLAAGMNDHIAKPLDPQVLVDTVSRWTRGALRVEAPAVADSPVPFEVAGVDVAALLRRLGGNEALVRRLLRDFASSAPDYAAACARAVQARDAEALDAAAHALKGMAANISAEAVRQAAAALEGALAAGGHDLDARVGALCEATAAVAEHIGREVAPPAPVAPPQAAPPPDALSQAMAALDAMLAESNLAAADTFARLRPALLAQCAPADVDALGAAIDGLDFDAARQHAAHLSSSLSS